MRVQTETTKILQWVTRPIIPCFSKPLTYNTSVTFVMNQQPVNIQSDDCIILLLIVFS